LDLQALGLGKYAAFEMIDQQALKVRNNNVYVKVPAGRTKVIQVTRESR
jgi:hypothetical protein